MKTLTTITLSIAALIFLGCEEIMLDDGSDNNTTTSGSYLPDEQDSEGPVVQLDDYLYPTDLVEDTTFYFTDVYQYAQDEDGAYSAPTVSQRSYTKQSIDDLLRITEYKDGYEQRYDHILEDRILSYEGTTLLQFPINVAKYTTVSEITENDITERCQVRQIGAKDLFPVLPLYVQNDLEAYLTLENEGFLFSQFNHESIMHIYCGTTDNHTTDSYYSNEFGLVLKVEKDIDNDIVKVEVVDVLSVVN